MKAGRPWIPTTALRENRVAQPFAAVVGAWAETWFATAGWRPADAFDAGVSPDWSVICDEGSFQLQAKPKALLELAFAALGEKPRQGLTDTDLRFLRRLGSRIVDDLARGVGAIAPSGSAAADGPAQPIWRLTIGRGQQAWLAIALSQVTLTAVARASFLSVAAKSPLTSIREALDDVPVPLSGRIGSARLAVEQIGSLEVGDLLLLDESIGAPLHLAVAGRLSNLCFKIDEGGDRLALTMQE